VRADDWATFLGTFACDLAADHDLDRISRVIVTRLRHVVPEAEDAALTLRRRRGFATAAATTELARDADQLQPSLGVGPLLDVAHDGAYVRSGDLARETRWSAWSTMAVEKGARSMLSLRLFSGDDFFGAITAYSEKPGQFGDQGVLDLASLYAQHGSLALATHRQVAGLRTAMESRHTIGVAQGILMREFDLDLEAAFALLTRYSSSLNVKLRVLAQHVVEHRRLPEDGGGGGALTGAADPL
jgi:hypothetical protein